MSFTINNVEVIFFLILGLFNSQVIFGSMVQPMVPYKSGLEISTTFFQEFKNTDSPEIEHGHFIQVPLDYNNRDIGYTNLYYHTIEPFDPNKPTMIYFVGGPGDSSHFYSSVFAVLNSWNVILFDYRGVSFSYPEQLEILENPNFFTSEFSAMDAFEIIKSLNIKKISVFGSSYGTLVATIFTHMYPEFVNATVLEGTIFSGTNLWSSGRRRKIIQKFFDKLPAETQNKILYYSSLPDFPSWFSRWAQKEMYSAHFEVGLRKKIDELFELSDSEVLEILNSSKKSFSVNTQDDLLFSYHYHYFIGCKELNLFSEESSFDFLFDGKKLFTEKSILGNQICLSMGLKESQNNPFIASNYTISTPVSYFQGTSDGATPADHSIKHYKTVSLGKAQIFFVPKFGHSPLFDLLISDDYNSQVQGLKLLNLALSGEIITLKEFKTFQAPSLKGWTMTSKNLDVTTFNSLEK